MVFLIPTDKPAYLRLPDDNDPYLRIRDDIDPWSEAFNRHEEFKAWENAAWQRLGKQDPFRFGDKILSFSGGGWNSHAILAGLFSGMLQKNGEKLDNLLASYNKLSANSGGAWFLSQLAYSRDFVGSLTQVNDLKPLATYEYSRQFRKAFESFSRLPVPASTQRFLGAELYNDKATVKSTLDTIPFAAGMLPMMLGDRFKLTWSQFIDDYVYGYKMFDNKNLRDINLDSPRLGWAREKDLTIALAVNSTPAMLFDVGFSSRVKLEPSAVSSPVVGAGGLGRGLGGPPWWERAYSVPNIKPAALPLLVVSDASSDGKKLSSYAEFPFGPGLTYYYDTPKTPISPINQRFTTDGFSLVDATTASSAALGLLASPDTFATKRGSTKEVSYFNSVASSLRKLAPIASFKNGNLDSISESSDGLDESGRQNLQALERYRQKDPPQDLRLADGGYIDDTSVAYALRELQSSKRRDDSPFEITLIMNGNLDPVTGLASTPGGTKVNGSIAVLFGLGYSGTATDVTNINTLIPFERMGSLNPYVPTAQVFNISDWQKMGKPKWSFKTDDNRFSMNLYSVPVTTVDNPFMGVKKGQHGVLNILDTNNSLSSPAPLSLETFDQYDVNFTLARAAVVKSGGWEALRTLFG